jgi:hypothetical protein
MDDLSTEFVKNLEAELTCDVCGERFDDPRVLPCLHTYCMKCVDSLDQQESASAEPEEKTDLKIVCPVCGVPGPKKRGEGELPKYPVFANLTKLLEIYKAGDSGLSGQSLTCENGQDSNPAGGRCLDCNVYLCNSCMELHKMRSGSSEKHVTVTLDEIKESGGRCLSRPSNCEKHKKELKLYCRTCAKLICDSCLASEADHHSSHECGLISDIQTEARKKLNDSLNSLRQLVEKAKPEKEKAAALMEKHKENVEGIHTKVDETISRVIQLLKERQKEIHGEIDAEAKKEEDAISADIKDAELILTRFAGGIGFADRLIQSACGTDLVSVARQAINQCEKLQKVKIENKKTEISEWDFDKADSHSAKVDALKVKVTLPLNYNHHTEGR